MINQFSRWLKGRCYGNRFLGELAKYVLITFIRGAGIPQRIWEIATRMHALKPPMTHLRLAKVWWSLVE